VTLVSGRPKLKMTPLLKELGLELPYIGSGGAYIVDPSKNLVILHCPLGQEETEAIVELARAAKAPIISQEPEHLYYEGSLEELEQLIASSKIDITGVEDSQVEILRVDDILQASAGPTKINICSKPGHLLEIEKELRLLNLPIYLTYSAPISLEITRSGINKGEALKILAAYLAIPLERILAIGDSHNDISMFKIAGMAVAMGNAPREVKAATDLVAPSNDEDGVAWVLREMVLKEYDPSCLRILNTDRTVHQYRSRKEIRMGASQFFSAFRSVFDQIEETQLETISKVAKWGAGAIAADRLIVLFGSGHSFIATMDTYPRIGSYPGWLPVHELSTSYMPTVLGNQALRQALYLEKVEDSGALSWRTTGLTRGMS